MNDEGAQLPVDDVGLPTELRALSSSRTWRGTGRGPAPVIDPSRSPGARDYGSQTTGVERHSVRHFRGAPVALQMATSAAVSLRS